MVITFSATTPSVSTVLFLMVSILFSDLIPIPWTMSENSNSTIRCVRKDKCFCPADPVTERYPDPADAYCDRYYLCHMGNAFLKYCEVRQAFHPEKKECVPRTSVPLTLCPTAVTCDKNGYLPDPKDCTMYYMCFYRQAYHYGCKVDSYYSKDKQECVVDHVTAIKCNKARSTEIQPQTSMPTKHKKRMLTEFVEPLPEDDVGQEVKKRESEVGESSLPENKLE